MLPLIIEKLGDTLKLRAAAGDKVNEVLVIEVFLTLRVIRTGMDPANMRSFWPVILTEMIYIFDKDPAPELVLAACKFLDLLLVLPSEHFNLHEWMFIVDKARKEFTSAYVPYIERLAPSSTSTVDYYPPKQRPVINIRNLSEIGYDGFLKILSQFCALEYCNIISGSPPDLEYINQLIAMDFIERDPTTQPPLHDDQFFELLAKQEKQEQQKELKESPSTVTTSTMQPKSGNSTENK